MKRINFDILNNVGFKFSSKVVEGHISELQATLLLAVWKLLGLGFMKVLVDVLTLHPKLLTEVSSS